MNSGFLRKVVSKQAQRVNFERAAASSKLEESISAPVGSGVVNSFDEFMASLNNIFEHLSSEAVF